MFQLLTGWLWLPCFLLLHKLSTPNQSHQFPSMARVFVPFVILALAFSTNMAMGQRPLQDFCVADLKGQVLVNGYTCKNPSLVQANDFYFRGLHMMGNTSNKFGSKVTPCYVTQIPGLNTLGIALARLDFAPWGINPPHTHPRATEIMTILEGSVEVGFITSNPENRHITKTLCKGDVFVFPIGLVHYQRNNGNTNAIAISALSSQSPGVMPITNVLFGSKPEVPTDILTKTFQTSDEVIINLQKNF